MDRKDLTVMPLTVDTRSLMKMLNCGRATAIEIGNKAEARIKIGKRVLWKTDRINAYLNKIAG